MIWPTVARNGWALLEAHGLMVCPVAPPGGDRYIQRFTGASKTSGPLSRPLAGPFKSDREAFEAVPGLLVRMALWGLVAWLVERRGRR